MDSKPLGGRYQIIQQLSAGGFSHTYLVRDLHLPSHPQCVVKQLKPQAKDAEALEMARRFFDTEARVLYTLGRHAQIPTLLAHFEDQQEFYLAQEFVEGVRLSSELRTLSPWPEDRVIQLLKEILEILVFVHQQQVIHRDIKPSNLIRRGQDGKIVLIDFGAVKQVNATPQVDPDTGATNLTVAIGTQGYMPNEQYAGKPRFSSDVYAVGMIGIRALTGVHPKRLRENPVTSELDWHCHAPWVTPSLVTVLDKMVRYDFRDRYPTAVETLQALNDLTDSRVPVGVTASLQVAPKSLSASSPSSATSDEAWGEQQEGLEEDGLETEETLATPTVSYQTMSLSSNPAPDLELEEADFPQNTRSIRISPTASADDETSILTQALADSPSSVLPTHFEVIPARGGGLSRKLLWIGGMLVVLGPLLAFWQSQGWLDVRRQSSNQDVLATPLHPLRWPQLPVSQLEMLLPEEQRANYLVRQGNELLAEGKPDQALATYDHAIQWQRDNADAYLGKCRSLLQLNQPNEAIVACNDSLVYKGYNPEAVLVKGNALEYQDRLLEALALYEATNRMMPAMFEAWRDRGRVLQKLGRSAEALKALEQAIARNRNSAETWAIHGEANWALKRYDQAIVSLDKALQLQPDYPEARARREEARQLLGR